MTPLIMFASLALVAMDATPATSTSTSQPDAGKPSATASANPQDRVICKREAITGSRFEKRICMTKAEWGEEERRTEEFERRLGQKPDVPQSNPMGGT